MTYQKGFTEISQSCIVFHYITSTFQWQYVEEMFFRRDFCKQNMLFWIKMVLLKFFRKQCVSCIFPEDRWQGETRQIHL